MDERQPYNVVVIKYEANGELHTVTTSAASADEDAVADAWEALQMHDIDRQYVLEIYSERRPLPETERFISESFPNVALSWSFDYGDDAEMARALDRLCEKKPWWKFW